MSERRGERGKREAGGEDRGGERGGRERSLMFSSESRKGICFTFPKSIKKGT